MKDIIILKDNRTTVFIESRLRLLQHRVGEARVYHATMNLSKEELGTIDSILSAIATGRLIQPRDLGDI